MTLLQSQDVCLEILAKLVLAHDKTNQKSAKTKQNVEQI